MRKFSRRNGKFIFPWNKAAKRRKWLTKVELVKKMFEWEVCQQIKVKCYFLKWFN